MAELLKDQYYLWSFYEKLGGVLKSHLPDFDEKDFLAEVRNRDIVTQDLKTKMYESARLMHQFLPEGFKHQISVVTVLGPEFGSLEGMFLPAWVELFGIENLRESVEALKKLTRYSSSEFAIRPFIVEDKKYVLSKMLQWADDRDEHVRRLSSEGCRPRLPWAMALTDLKKDPEPILPILNKLKEDESLYVRKSVANNINDITKDNPEVALDLVERWGYGKHQHTDWIIKHGLRSLIKAGDPRALKLLGFEKPKVKVDRFSLKEHKVKMGGELEMELTLENIGPKVNIMLDYAVHFMRDKGKTGKKVFKWKSFALAAKERITLRKSHSFKIINTRKYYPGQHKVEVQINGEVVTFMKFDLLDN